MAMAARLALGVLLLFFVVVVVQAQQRGGGGGGGGGGGTTLRGSVACLDCAPGHDLSGVVVAVRCGGGDGAVQLRAAQTDERGGFDVAVPADGGGGGHGRRRCAARVLGGAEQLCAPGRLAVAPVVAPAEPGSYALGSRLAVLTRCGGAVAATTAAATGSDQSPAPPRARRTPTTRRTQPRPGRGTGRPYDGPGLPLIYFFPFLPIIGIP
ncbi:protein argonaute 12 [Oryza brachyantha]|uniref:protein argonaute 12 n=1 Tax=Oryza brachyantha TaxID=4533 RepID=UPI001ADBB48B|nr:protein argonaute 12 [Oryza brachyantha]